MAVALPTTKGLCMNVSLKDLSLMAKEKKTVMTHEKLVVGNKYFCIASYSIFLRPMCNTFLPTSPGCRISTKILWLYMPEILLIEHKRNLNFKENIPVWFLHRYLLNHKLKNQISIFVDYFIGKF